MRLKHRSKANNGGLKWTQFAYREAADYYRQAAARSPPRRSCNAPSTLNFQGRALHDAGDYRDAAGPLAQALALREKALGPEHPQVATSLNNLAELYHTQGQYAKAEPLYQRALIIHEKALGPEHPNVATLRKNYAASLRAAGRAAEADALQARAASTAPERR